MDDSGEMPGGKGATATVADHPPCTKATKRCKFETWGPGATRPNCCTEHILEVAFFVEDLLSRHGIFHWLDFGCLLGAVRDGGLIPWDRSMDMGVLVDDLERINALGREVEGAGFHLRQDPLRPSIRYSEVNLVGVDFFPYARRGDFYEWQGEERAAEWWPGLVGQEHIPAHYLVNLEPVALHGKEFPAPSPVHRFLAEHRYGPDYMTPKRRVGYGLYPDIRPEEMTPLVIDLLDRIRDRQARATALEEASGRIRHRVWRRSTRPEYPDPPLQKFVEAVWRTLPDIERTPIAEKLVESVAMLDQAIAELSGRSPRLKLHRASRRAHAFRRGWPKYGPYYRSMPRRLVSGPRKRLHVKQTRLRRRARPLLRRIRQLGSGRARERARRHR